MLKTSVSSASASVHSSSIKHKTSIVSRKKSSFASDKKKLSFATPEALSPILLWRRAEPKDVQEIQDLVKDPQTIDLFGNFDVAAKIEHSYISLNQVNTLGKIVSHISLYDYPNIHALPQCQWLHWIKGLYTLSQATNRNTLFIHLLVWDPSYVQEFLRIMLDSLFMNYNYLQHIVLVVPPGAPVPRIIRDYFTELLPRDYTGVHKVQTLYLCMRQLHVRKLRIRRAVEEDNDDLIPILDNLASEMRVLYGEFYIAEMAKYPNKKKEIIVAEENQMAMGVMVLSTDINYELLNEQFELATFYGLRRFDERDKMSMEMRYRPDSRMGLSMPVYLDEDEDEDDEEGTVKDKNAPLTMEEIIGKPINSIASKSSISSVSLTASGIDMLLLNNESNDSIVEVRPKKDTLDIDFDEEDNYNLTPSMGMHMSMEDIPSSELSTSQLITEPPPEREEYMKIPIYYGPDNAFSIEVFALNEAQDERLAFDFLEAAFEVYPDLDYCIITLPSANPCFAMLDHFTRVTPRLTRSFPHELYVVHRNSVTSELDVRESKPEDDDSVENLLSNNSDTCDAILPIFQAGYNHSDDAFQSFVLTSENTVVGMAVICKEYDVQYLRCHFTIDDLSNFDLHDFGCHGIITHMALSPIFHRHSRYFLKEIHRLSYCTILFYPLIYNDSVDIDKKREHHSITTAIGDMVPILPRRQILYYTPLLRRNQPNEEEQSYYDTPFSLYMMIPRYTSLKKIEINTKIVVVGASETGLAFLEALILGESCTYLTFNNVTLVSPNGLPHNSPGDIAERYWPYHGSYNSQYMERINLRSYVNLVYGHMTAISRRNKYIVVDGETTVPFEYLMLFCGEQFPRPVNTTEHLHIQKDKQCLHENRALHSREGACPSNVFMINSEVEALNAKALLKRLISHQKETDYQIIVYGHCINAFCCVDALLDTGISGSNIIFVECSPQESNPNSFRNNKELDDMMIFGMQELGVKICSGFYFAESTKDDRNQITNVTFESKTKRIKLDCLAMFYFGYKDVSPRTLKAIYLAGLVYDGRLVITPNFETNDPNIFAAGPMTKYKRRYYADHLVHSYFNSVEIGTKMGDMFRRRLDPTIVEHADDTNRYVLPIRRASSPLTENMLTPDYVKPLICSCTLSGGMKYLHVCKPGMIKPLETAMGHASYGQVLSTGDYSTPNPGFFRLHLNAMSLVETITCYTADDIDVDNLIRLYGLHERLLNNLVLRFNMRRIPDLFEYFREPWAYAIYHDRFERLKNEARMDLLRDFTPEFENHVVNDVLAAFEGSEWKKLTDTARETIGKKFNENGYARRIEQLVIKFIDTNQYHLPMYATPLVVRRLLFGVNNSELDSSPLHRIQ